MNHQQASSSSNMKPRGRDQNFNLEYFRIRLIARLGILLGVLVLFIPRLQRIAQGINISTAAQLFTILSIPFQTLVILTIALEYFFYKKYSSSIVKYSTLVDIIILIFFTTDWIITTLSVLYNVEPGSPICFPVWTSLGFVSFSWRTLMVTLIVQNWYLKIIAPALNLSLTAGYLIHYSPQALAVTLMSTITQLFTLSAVIYCEDQVKWKMVWANIQKEKWMQVNNFILDSIPENIVILDLKGEARFISEDCKSFLQKCHLTLDIKDLFKKVHDLKKQEYEPDVGTMQIERLETENKFLPTADDENKRLKILEELILDFRSMITNREIQEKQFLIYDGKLKIDESHQEKSLEVKISFVQHFENIFILLLVRDTTQRDLLVTLEETNKYKDQLLASVSHELRAPLNGNINLVESAVSSPKIPISVKVSCLIPALRSSKFLLHMINDILDMSQIKEKKLRLVFNSENLKETLKNTAQLIEIQVKKKGIELLVDIDPSIPSRFCTDHIRLSQIVLNLLNNAIKFTKEGTIKLIAETISGSSSVKITVADSGIGMSQENIKKLFSSYTHIEFEGRQNMNPTGVGLGLNIAYNLAVLLGPQDHQGIMVTSVPGQGSTFTFIVESQEKVQLELEDHQDSCEIVEELPQPIQSMLFHQSRSNSSLALVKSQSSFPDLNNSCTCPKVLIVDDNPFNTMACETILGSLEVKCESVYSGSACIKSLLNRQTKPCGANCKQYSIVFMDQEMPEMSGGETVCEIKRLQKENLLPLDMKIIGCTAHKSKEEVDAFMGTGIDQCIHKPISIDIIKNILKENSPS